MKWANAIEKMVLIDLVYTGLPYTFDLLKKKKKQHPQYNKKA